MAGLNCAVNGWFGDFFRTGWALWYWNTRKTLFVLNRRRGHCPCHHPSDTGRVLATGCEAVMEWRRPERFQRRVCPLLTRNAEGDWVCGVGPEAVRPFWRRTFFYSAGALAVAAVLAGLLAFGGLRGIGYKVSLRQVFWPPAWREFRQVQAQLFIDQAQAHFQAGRASEAISALTTAYEQSPDNYRVGIMLAQYYQVGNAALADRIYRRMLGQHPAKRRETARAYFATLLAQGRLGEVAGLAAYELKTERAESAGWLHALIFAVRQSGHAEWLEVATKDPAVGANERAVLALEWRVRQASRAEAARVVRSAPLVDGFAYARRQRAELLIEFGRPKDALALLASSREVLGGREIVELALAAEVAGGDEVARRRDFLALLSAERRPAKGELTLAAVHLIYYPQAELLAKLVEQWPAVVALPGAADREEVALTLLAAVAVAGNKEVFVALRDKAIAVEAISHAAGVRLTEGFFPANGVPQMERLLPSLQDLSLGLNYALNDWGRRVEAAKDPASNRRP